VLGAVREEVGRPAQEGLRLAVPISRARENTGERKIIKKEGKK
jgi:hypothetical protein